MKLYNRIEAANFKVALVHDFVNLAVEKCKEDATGCTILKNT